MDEISARKGAKIKHSNLSGLDYVEKRTTVADPGGGGGLLMGSA